MEVIPIYNTCLIFMNMFCGAVILDEYMMYSASELAFLFVTLCISVTGIFMLVKKPSLKACFKFAETKTVTSTSDYRNYENYFKINENPSIASLTIESFKSRESDFDSFEENDIFQRRTRSSSYASAEESCDMHYTCFENSRNYCCPCMQHSLNMFD